MIIENPVRLIRELKGAPLSIIFALSLVRQRVTQEWLERSTGYTDKPVSQALAYLQEIGLVNKTGAGWQLTGSARQLPMPIALEEPSDPEEPASDEESPETSRNISDSQSLDSLNLTEKSLTTDSLDSEVGIFPTPGPPEPDIGRILTAAGDLFGSRLRGKAGEYGDARLLLAWIAQAWDNRGQGKGQAHSPAGLVYWAFHKGAGAEPDSCYLDCPEDYLPESFLQACGLLPEGLPVPDDIPEPEDPDPQETEEPSLPENIQPIWNSLAEQLRIDLPPSSFAIFQRSRPVRYQDGVFDVETSSDYDRDWLNARLASTMARILSGICNQSIRIRFSICTQIKEL